MSCFDVAEDSHPGALLKETKIHTPLRKTPAYPVKLGKDKLHAVFFEAISDFKIRYGIALLRLL